MVDSKAKLAVRSLKSFYFDGGFISPLKSRIQVVLSGAGTD